MSGESRAAFRGASDVRAIQAGTSSRRPRPQRAAVQRPACKPRPAADPGAGLRRVGERGGRDQDQPPNQVGSVARDGDGDGRAVGVPREDNRSFAVPFDQPDDGGGLVVEVEVRPEPDRRPEAEQVRDDRAAARSAEFGDDGPPNAEDAPRPWSRTSAGAPSALLFSSWASVARRGYGLRA
jgi:hypothetical protein